jgi:hypothetical protein
LRQAPKRTAALAAVGASALVAVVVVVARDPGRAVYDEAVRFEEQGNVGEAASRYDAVCRRAPDSKLCAPSIARAAAIRLRAADDAVQAFRFSEAEELLKQVSDAGDAALQAKARGKLTQPDLVLGLRWESALALRDKRAALETMEVLASSAASVGAEATAWLAKERPGILIGRLRELCPQDDGQCGPLSNRLEQLHPGTPEAKEASVLHAAWRMREDLRAQETRLARERALYPLRLEAEKVLKECVAVHAASEQHRQCMSARSKRTATARRVRGALTGSPQYPRPVEISGSPCVGAGGSPMTQRRRSRSTRRTIR